MTLSRRLLLTRSIVLAALMFIGSIGLWRFYEAQQRFEYVQSNIIPGVKELEDAKYNIGGYARPDRRYLLSTNGAGRVAAQQAIDALSGVVDQHIATSARDDISDDTDRQMLAADRGILLPTGLRCRVSKQKSGQATWMARRPC
ncbi:hypothetical protein [Paraburkholderia sp. RL17-337-BIB-A]|uniref:hypothetical protein n=1 Tax=Paraburkholderia sp. RL17-337-BIB-A TaxID=3031636 RepID=UPI0038BB2040